MNLDIHDGLAFGLGFCIAQGFFRIMGLCIMELAKGICK